jgi:hypothetical protein
VHVFVPDLDSTLVTARGTFPAVYRMPRSWLLAIIWMSPGCGGKADAPSPAEITDRSWHAHELVIAAGEAAKTCTDAGPAMQRVFAQHRQAFADAMALDSDKQRLREATEYIEVHEARYKDLEDRMEALSNRCAHDPTVAAVFRQLSGG